MEATTIGAVIATILGILGGAVTIAALRYFATKTTLVKHQDLSHYVAHAVKWAEQTMQSEAGQAKFAAVMDQVRKAYPKVSDQFIAVMIESYVQQLKSWTLVSLPDENQ